MPVKIVSNNGNTSPDEGVIRKAHLEKMRLDFVNDVAVASPTRTINKRCSFLFSKFQFQALFDKDQTADLVLINIGVQIPNTIDICENDESNSLAAVVQLAYRNPDNSQIRVIDEIEDYILINGYEDNELDKFGDGCCPSSDPPGGT